MSSLIQLLIISDIRLYREGLAQMLSRVASLSVVGAEPDCSAVIDRYGQAMHADIVLLDVLCVEQRAAIARLRSMIPNARVVALGVADEENDVIACAEAGATGYVTREASLADLVAAIESAAKGELHCSPRTAGRLLERVAVLAGERRPSMAKARLTTRECEIIRLIDEDLSNKQIAGRLGIQVATVKNHIHNVLDKLNVRSRAEAVRLLGHSPRWPRDMATGEGA